ncbi:MAG: fibronectin type III domain-containing protein, partial [Planctomycetaceae bacterium]
NRFRKPVYLPDHNVVLLENFHRSTASRTGRWEQQIWTYRYAKPEADPRPRPPRDLTVVTEENGATLSWKPAEGSNVAGWEVHRGVGDEKTPAWKIEYASAAKLPANATTWTDDSLRTGQVAFFFIRAVDENGSTSGDSVKVRAQPRLVEDIVVSAISPKRIHVSWKPPADAKDVVGYIVERAPVQVYSEDQIKRLKSDTPPPEQPAVGMVRAIGEFVRLTDKPVAATEFIDEGVDLSKPHESIENAVHTNELPDRSRDDSGKPYRYGVFAYRVLAVNRLGVAGGDSPYALTIPSAPQRVFSREEGDKCRVRWEANPEKNIAGYRVYRMDDPRINGAGQKTLRRFDEPVAATAWTDEEAGSGSKRYWIVAVDGLGQEGIPSSPTWHNREWREFYVDFHGDWHQ